MEEKRPLRRQPEDHHFWSLIMLAVIAAAFLLVVWVATRTPVVFLRVANGPGLDQVFVDGQHFPNGRFHRRSTP
jgi:hypothetical protein